MFYTFSKRMRLAALRAKDELRRSAACFFMWAFFRVDVADNQENVCVLTRPVYSLTRLILALHCGFCANLGGLESAPEMLHVRLEDPHEKQDQNGAGAQKSC